MYYEIAANDHGLPHDPLKALVAPRPIGWISSLSADGVPNLAPYSFFNMLAVSPAIVGFSSGMRKDSQNNIEETGEFVYNFASVDLIDAVNISSSHVPNTVNEFELAGVTAVASSLRESTQSCRSPCTPRMRILTDSGIASRFREGNPLEPNFRTGSCRTH